MDGVSDRYQPENIQVHVFPFPYQSEITVAVISWKETYLSPDRSTDPNHSGILSGTRTVIAVGKMARILIEPEKDQSIFACSG
jgi:hypothetical protein